MYFKTFKPTYALIDFYEGRLETARERMDAEERARGELLSINQELGEQNTFLYNENVRLNDESDKQFLQIEGARIALQDEETALEAVRAFREMTPVDTTGEEKVCGNPGGREEGRGRCWFKFYK